jgi:hypothetical protein
VRKLEQELKSLKRGLMSGDERVALIAYKALYEIGTPAATAVALELERLNLKVPLLPEASKLLAGLVALQRDLDEATSDAFIDAKLSQPLPQVTSSILRSARRMRSSDFATSRCGDIMIFEYTAIDTRYEASKHMQTWLSQLPVDDLIGVSRIYIVPDEFNNDWLGRYMPLLGVVTIAWTTILPPFKMLNRLTSNMHRHVLLHEIGHHVHKHWFGQIPEQEAQADAYARSAKYRTMPMWARCARKLFASISKCWRSAEA